MLLSDETLFDAHLDVSAGMDTTVTEGPVSVEPAVESFADVLGSDASLDVPVVARVVGVEAASSSGGCIGASSDEAVLRAYEALQRDPLVSNAKKALHQSGLYRGSLAQMMRVLRRARDARAASTV